MPMGACRWVVHFLKSENYTWTSCQVGHLDQVFSGSQKTELSFLPFCLLLFSRSILSLFSKNWLRDCSYVSSSHFPCFLGKEKHTVLFGLLLLFYQKTRDLESSKHGGSFKGSGNPLKITGMSLEPSLALSTLHVLAHSLSWQPK